MNSIDINKIVDDAMEKKDREVCIYVSDIGTTVKVKPLSVSDPRWIIHETKKPGSHFPVREFECSECHTWIKEPMPYCGFCGEKLRLPTEEEHKKKDMAKFEIWFGKDPEELEFDCSWPDVAINSDAFKNKYVAEMFRTEDATDFWNKFIDIHVNPNAMWYWVIIDGKTTISGAIDPDDIYGPDVPAWVRNTIKMRMSLEECRKKEVTDKCKTCKWSHLSPWDEVCASCEEGNRYEEATKECRGDCNSCDDTDCQNTPDEEVTDDVK